MSKTLYILRGVSGAGKTDLSEILKNSLPKAVTVAADDYFYNKLGEYEFDHSKLKEAHEYCKYSVHTNLKFDTPNVILHNTSTREWEIEPYITLAEEYGYKVISLVVENRHGSSSIHGVPQDVIELQRSNIRENLML